MEFNPQLFMFYLSLAALMTAACFHPAGLLMILCAMIVGTFAFAAQDIGIIGVLQIIVCCTGLFAFLLPVMRFYEKTAAHNLEIREGLAQKRFPAASSKEVDCMAQKLTWGHSLADFIWDGNRVILLTGNDAKIAGLRGWISLKVPKRPYIYSAQQQVLAYRLAVMDVTLTPKANHDLCALLFFNWKIESLTLDQNSHTMAAALRRRADSRIEHLSLQPPRSIAAS